MEEVKWLEARQRTRELVAWIVDPDTCSQFRQGDLVEFKQRIAKIPNFDPGALLRLRSKEGRTGSKEGLSFGAGAGPAAGAGVNLWGLAWIGRKWTVVSYLTRKYGKRISRLPFVENKTKNKKDLKGWPLVVVCATLLTGYKIPYHLKRVRLLVELISKTGRNLSVWDDMPYSCLYTVLITSQPHQLSSPDSPSQVLAQAILKIGGRLYPSLFTDEFLKPQREQNAAQAIALSEFVPIPGLATLIAEYSQSIVMALMTCSRPEFRRWREQHQLPRGGTPGEWGLQRVRRELQGEGFIGKGFAEIAAMQRAIYGGKFVPEQPFQEQELASRFLVRAWEGLEEYKKHPFPTLKDLFKRYSKEPFM